MLPTSRRDIARLADVLTSSFAAIQGAPNPLALGPVDSAIVLLVDGLGVTNLRERRGHARTLHSALTKASIAETVFPSTTAAALSSLTTGVEPGEHGIVGYTVRDPYTGTVLNQLTGWGELMPPESWQRAETVFERGVKCGLRMDVIGLPKYADSGFTKAVLRGANYIEENSIADRLSAAVERSATPGLTYVYVAELDMVAHAKGWESGEWTARLEELDSAVLLATKRLASAVGMLVTADHGIIDVPAHRHLLIDLIAPELISSVTATAGDPRALMLYLSDAVTAAERLTFARSWQDALGADVWALSREEALGAGLYGVSSEIPRDVALRIGDIVIAAKRNVALYDSRTASAQSRAMIGQHGSFSDEERRVPLLRYGAFAK